MSGPMSQGLIARRRAVEALRSGVPSWDAVAVLGSGQPATEDRFSALLERATEPAWPGAESPGLLLGGGFGSGKSHLLTHLGHLAMTSGFVVSTVVISKHPPLHDPVKVFRAATHTAVDPGPAHAVLAESAAPLHPYTPRYAELSRWVSSPVSGLDERFPATLLCHEPLRGADVPATDEPVHAPARFC